MKLAQKLAEWEAAGFLDAAQRQRIEAHEAARARPVLFYALAGLGAFTLGVGILSVVAANWDGIGKPAKLGLDLLLIASVSALLYAAKRAEKQVLVEVAAGVQYALTLASVGLLGQVYQLGAPLYQGLLLWTGLTIPLMTLIRGRILAWVWLGGTLTTEGFALEALIEHLAYGPTVPVNYDAELMAALLVPAWALPFLAAHVPAFARPRPLVAHTVVESMWLLLLAAGLAVSCVFYANSDAHLLHWGAWAFALELGGLAGLVWKLYPAWPVAARAGMMVAVLLVASAGVLGTTFVREDHASVAALFHVLLLGSAAFVALKLGSARGFHAFAGLIALRILIGYVELFGSMLDTGLGMIAGGMLTLLLLWVWTRKTAAIARRMGGAGEAARES
jgi:uncharacterized membrane protein